MLENESDESERLYLPDKLLFAVVSVEDRMFEEEGSPAVLRVADERRGLLEDRLFHNCLN